MTYEDIEDSQKQRSDLRFRVPGISTLNFEAILDVVMNSIIGWKTRKVKPGLFGTPKAYFYAVEEQARRNLHVHILLWVNDVPFSQERLIDMSKIENSFEEESSKLKNYVGKFQSCHLVKKVKNF